MDPYKVLGVFPYSSSIEIKEAYEKILNDYNIKDIEEIDRFIAQMKTAERQEHWAKMIGELLEKGVYPPIDYIMKNLFFNDKQAAITYMEKSGYNMDYYRDK